jgi:gas vesicle protein
MKKMKKALYLILAGVAVGILIAPDKGSETWRKVKEGFDDWKDDAMDQLNGIVSKGKDLAGKGKGAFESVKTEVENKANGW